MDIAFWLKKFVVFSNNEVKINLMLLTWFELCVWVENT